MWQSVVRSLLPFWEKGGCFIAGRDRNANKGAWRALLILSQVVFLLRRLVEYTSTDTAEMFSRGRTCLFDNNGHCVRYGNWKRHSLNRIRMRSILGRFLRIQRTLAFLLCVNMTSSLKSSWQHWRREILFILQGSAASQAARLKHIQQQADHFDLTAKRDFEPGLRIRIQRTISWSSVNIRVHGINVLKVQ